MNGRELRQEVWNHTGLVNHRRPADLRTTLQCRAAATILALVSLTCASLARQGKNPLPPQRTEPQASPISVFSGVKERPEPYTEQSLANFLKSKLTPEEIASVRNPLASTPEMKGWARKITAGTTNELQKAKLLFDELVRRVNPPGPGDNRTAQEVFAAWDSPRGSFSCEEYANYYVSLARAVGLEAISGVVVKQYSGTTPRHGVQPFT